MACHGPELDIPPVSSTMTGLPARLASTVGPPRPANASARPSICAVVITPAEATGTTRSLPGSSRLIHASA